jgi:hypothetical protein
MPWGSALLQPYQPWLPKAGYQPFQLFQPFHDLPELSAKAIGES